MTKPILSIQHFLPTITRSEITPKIPVNITQKVVKRYSLKSLNNLRILTVISVRKTKK